MKFKGDFSSLIIHLQHAGFDGVEIEQNGYSRFKTDDGGIVDHWPSTGTVRCHGQSPHKEELNVVVSELCDAPVPKKSVDASGQRIFVVHGHDHRTRDDLELYLRRLGLEPYILQNDAGKGLTIIEELESYIGKNASSSFGIVLLTPDDRGYAEKDGHDKAQPRARQNVILEMGMLLSSLTRSRVAILRKVGVEQPSDMEGLKYIGFENEVKEAMPQLIQRLQSADFDIDAKKIGSVS